MRRTSAQPEGGVIVTVLGPTATEAIITSSCTTPAGLVIVSVFDPPAPIPRSARIWVTPEYGVVLAPFVAVFAPVAPAVACTALLPSSVMPPVVLPTCTSTISVIPVGGVQ